ncbi:MAG: hypothetical protein UHW86_03695 [Spirochaetota bacterium]|nr:hypothetical protein [Spirochaetota bacterium]
MCVITHSLDVFLRKHFVRSRSELTKVHAIDSFSIFSENLQAESQNEVFNVVKYRAKAKWNKCVQASSNDVLQIKV